LPKAGAGELKLEGRKVRVTLGLAISDQFSEGGWLVDVDGADLSARGEFNAIKLFGPRLLVDVKLLDVDVSNLEIGLSSVLPGNMPASTLSPTPKGV
jgi:hypothetical protein